MISRIRRPIYSFMGIAALSVALSGCIIHVNAKDWESDWDSKESHSESYSGDIKATNKSVKVSEGRTVENVSSVNGSVSIKDNVSAKKVSSVNGKVSVGDNVNVTSLESVNGQIKVGDNFTSTNDVGTVNGAIRIEEGSSVGGEIKTVNGSIRLEGVKVAKSITTKNGNVYLKDGTVIYGDIHFQEVRKNKYKQNNPTLFISADSSVEGDIILDRPVDLEFENTEMESKVKRNY